MVLRKPVLRLENACLARLQEFVIETCSQLVRLMQDDDLQVDVKQSLVAGTVSRLHLYLWDKVVWYLYDQVVFHVMEGVVVALERKKETWTPVTDMPQFSLEIWAALKVGDLILHRSLQRLCLPLIPKMLRTTVLSNLHSFPRLRHLQFDSSSSSVPHIQPGASLHMSVCRAVAAMTRLVSFSLKHDATDRILEALVAAGCSNTLRNIDLEFSVQINDSSLPLLLQLDNVTQLGVAKTRITAEGQARLLVQLTKLRRLIRGDFLCEALEWVAWERMYEDKPRLRLNITNFVASETYFFHSTDQMLLTSEMCPDIEEMLFLHQDRFTCDLSVLARFQKLKQLELWGGDFYVDKMEDLFGNIGQRLEKLELHHVENIDQRAIAILSIKCCKLIHLVFGTCGFFDPQLDSLGGGAPEDELYLLQQMALKRENKNNLRPFIDVEVLSIDGRCPKNLIVTILSVCLNVRRLEVGNRTQICDHCFDEVLKVNKLKKLEILEIKSNTELSLKTVSSLLFYCDHIKVISDLNCWIGVAQEEVDQLQEHMTKCNADIIFTKTQKQTHKDTIYQMYQAKLLGLSTTMHNWPWDEYSG